MNDSKRSALSNFWMTRADVLERMAVCMFRDAGAARANVQVVNSLPDDAIEKLFAELEEKKKGEGIKTLVEPEDGTGKVN